MNDTPEIPEGVIKAIEYYVEAGRQSKVELSRKAFAETATMSWVENGKRQTVPIETFFKSYEGWPPSEVTYEIRACDVDENIAIISLNSQFAETKYTDMFTLVKDGDEWKIVSKIYQLKK